MPTPILELIDVTKHYGESVEVLRGINLSLAAGESLAIVGPSGSGKTTLLNLLGALDRPTAGSVRLEGRDLSKLNDDELAAIRNQRIGFVFQSHHLLPQCSALENVLLPALVTGKANQRDTLDRAAALLKRVGLGDRLHHRPGQLSGGQAQRVAVVRALINQPALLLADEPTGSLDRATSDELADLLLQLHREDKLALVIVTHAPTLAARMGRSVQLVDGQLK